MSNWTLRPVGGRTIRGPLYEDDYRPQLSGHETFPLRYGWLKKAFDAVEASEDETENRAVFKSDSAIAHFGVGKNMVASMRHWSTAAGVLEEVTSESRFRTTPLGRLLFRDDGLDPYMEDPSTSWLVHWNVSGNPVKTTWFWAFNHYPALSFERDMLVRAISRLASERNWSRASAATIRRDVSCFVRTYVPQPISCHAGYEDALESPLTELGLIKSVGRRDGFRFVRGPKPSLGCGVFVYAVTDFWNRHSPDVHTLSFEALAHEPGSPGRVFLLEENDLIDLLVSLEEFSNGIYRWSETAGLKQLIRFKELTYEDALNFVQRDYTLIRPEKLSYATC
ncbi:MAG: DUF4007 family protein [Truepera sp.]|nr:DUF4007 family protein [Truepera sp.]